MFFANYVQGKDKKKCADNDGHNVDTIDGLVPLIPIALSRVGLASERAALKKDIKDCIWVNRASTLLEKYGEVYVDMLHQSLAGQDMQEICEQAGSRLGINVKKMMAYTQGDPMCACYLDSSFPTLLYYAHKYGDDPEMALLRSTNAGGENVARGALLGALLGAKYGLSKMPPRFVEGLVDRERIRKEINTFADLAMKNAGVEK
jgi:hypothetical protein